MSLPIFCFSPILVLPVTMAHRIKNMQFGDGYLHRRRDGINTKAEVWDLKFPPLTENGPLSDAGRIQSFCDLVGGDEAFLWKPPNQLRAKYILVQPIQKEYVGANEEGLQVVFALRFKRVYE